MKPLRHCRRDAVAIMAAYFPRRNAATTMRKAWLLFSQTVTIAVALLFVVATLKPAWLKRGPDATVAAAPDPPPAVALPAPVQSVSLIGPGTAATSYADAAKRASPAVVSITASRVA